MEDAIPLGRRQGQLSADAPLGKEKRVVVLGAEVRIHEQVVQGHGQGDEEEGPHERGRQAEQRGDVAEQELHHRVDRKELEIGHRAQVQPEANDEEVGEENGSRTLARSVPLLPQAKEALGLLVIMQNVFVVLDEGYGRVEEHPPHGGQRHSRKQTNKAGGNSLSSPPNANASNDNAVHKFDDHKVTICQPQTSCSRLVSTSTIKNSSSATNRINESLVCNGNYLECCRSKYGGKTNSHRHVFAQRGRECTEDYSHPII